jgi:hypothetical protein
MKFNRNRHKFGMQGFPGIKELFYLAVTAVAAKNPSTITGIVTDLRLPIHLPEWFGE